MIGIFDSGIGGLTVAREAMRQLPGFSILYLGDTARTPYGNKSPEVVCRFAFEAADWLIRRDAKVLLVACNTMSALALSALRERFPRVPIFDVLAPAVQLAASKSPSDDKRIGVIGTRATIRSKVYDRLLAQLHPGISVFSAACPLFVPLVEEGWIDQQETHRIARAYLEPLREKRLHCLILGCTHYPFLASVIRGQMGRRVALIDSAQASVRYLKNYLDAEPGLVDQLPKGNRHEFYLTDVAPHHGTLASAWLGRPVSFARAELKPIPEIHGKPAH